MALGGLPKSGQKPVGTSKVEAQHQEVPFVPKGVETLDAPPTTKTPLPPKRTLEVGKKSALLGLQSAKHPEFARIDALSIDKEAKSFLKARVNEPKDRELAKVLLDFSESKAFAYLAEDAHLSTLRTLEFNLSESPGQLSTLADLLREPSFSNASALEQVQRITQAEPSMRLIDQPRIESALRRFRRRTEFTLNEVGPTSLKDLDPPVPMIAFELLIPGEPARAIWVPEHPDPSFHNHSANDIARCLAALPKEARELLAHVLHFPAPGRMEGHIHDELWMAVDPSNYKDGVGSVFAFPTERTKMDLHTTASVLAHEAGHVFSWKHLGPSPVDDPAAPLSPGWQRWEAAAAADKSSVSAYAKVNLEEDFAETFRLWVALRDSPDEWKFRATFRARFEMIDELVGVMPSH